MAEVKKIIYSFSSISKFLGCPYQWKCSYILKNIPYKPHAATVWGSDVHDALDKRLKTKKPLVPKMAEFEKYANAVEQIKGELHSEYEMAVDENWKRVGWWDKSAVQRGKTDVSVINNDKCSIVDWKTGKYRPSNELEYFSMLTFKIHPEVEKIKTTFLWFQGDGEPTVDYYKRSELDGLVNKYADIIGKIEDAMVYDKFPPKKSGLCQNFCGSPSCKHSGSFNGIGEV